MSVVDNLSNGAATIVPFSVYPIILPSSVNVGGNLNTLLFNDVLVSTPTTPITFTVLTAAQLLLNFPPDVNGIAGAPVLGLSTQLHFVNASANAITWAAFDASVSIIGNPVVAANSSRILHLVLTAVNTIASPTALHFNLYM